MLVHALQRRRSRPPAAPVSPHGRIVAGAGGAGWHWRELPLRYVRLLRRQMRLLRMLRRVLSRCVLLRWVLLWPVLLRRVLLRRVLREPPKTVRRRSAAGVASPGVGRSGRAQSGRRHLEAFLVRKKVQQAAHVNLGSVVATYKIDKIGINILRSARLGPGSFQEFSPPSPHHIFLSRNFRRVPGLGLQVAHITTISSKLGVDLQPSNYRDGVPQKAKKHKGRYKRRTTIHTSYRAVPYKKEGARTQHTTMPYVLRPNST